MSTAAERRILVVCDDPSHPSRRVAITRFVRLPDGTWHEQPTNRASTAVGTGYHLVRDAPAESGWALDDEVANADVRTSHELVCRKCKHRRDAVKVNVREATLAEKLDAFATLGLEEVPLATLAASLIRSHRKG